MATTIELAETRSNLIGVQKSILEKAERENAGKLTPEQHEEFQNNNATIEQLGDQIDAQERRETVETFEAELRQTKPRKSSPHGVKPELLSKREMNNIWRAWATGHTSNPDTLYKAAECGLPIHRRDLQQFGLSTDGSNAGAEYVQTTFVNQLEQAILYHFPMGSVITTWTTDNGEPRELPTVDDTANRAVVVGEGASVLSEGDPETDKIESTVAKYRSKLVPVTTEELQDSQIDIPSLLAGLFAERFGRAYSEDATTALVSGASTGVHLASGNALTVGKFYDLLGLLDPGYQTGPKFAIMMHTSTWSDCCQLEDGDGRLLFPNINAAVDRRLLGVPVVLNNYLPSRSAATANQTIILAGDFSKFWQRIVAGGRLVRYNELMADTDEIAFQYFQRSGFFYRGFNAAIKPIKAYTSGS